MKPVPPVTTTRIPLGSTPVPGVANLVAELEGRLRPLEVEVGRAWWDFSTRTSEQTDRRRQEAELRLREALSDRDAFAAVSQARRDAVPGSLERRQVDAATAAPFAEWKGRLDAERAARFGCAVGDLRPWHYDDPFFQEPPRVAGLDLDEHFAAADLESLTVRTYEGLGLDVRPVMEQSDLYSREGKSQHAFCIHIDREGDVRVLSNNVPNERWASTMLHEFGHAAYDRYIDLGLPFVLRAPSHMLATEAVAMLFGRRSRDPDWLAGIGGMPEDRLDRTRPALAETQRGAGLVFARWALVVVQFERGLYRDPDADHDRRWWDLVERHQRIARPESRPGRAAGDGAVGSPDWAAKIHLAVAPVYYQNYLYGELMASQLDAALKACAGGVVDRAAAGRWLVENVFRPGAAKRWDELVTDATGEPLSARHFVA